MGNNGGVYTWSQTAANNATADNTVNWQEGQAPSSINDSGRAMMASMAKYRDDISGKTVTTGTSTAYIVSSNQQFDSLADFNGQMIAFTPHATNGPGPVTMTVDGFANLPLRSAPNVELPSGVLVLGTPYMARFNQADNALYLHGFFGTMGVPLFGGMDYWDTIAPSSQFIFPMGQAISRTAFPQAFARWGTKFGAGDGSTTFNVPNKTGRLSAMLEATPTLLTALAGFTGSGDSTQLGAEAGNQGYTQQRSDMPNITLAFHGVASGQAFVENSTNTTFVDGASSSGQAFGPSPPVAATAAPSGTIDPLNGNVTQTTMRTVPPIIMCNYIIRVI
jgi:microcystin-dependent protein